MVDTEPPYRPPDARGAASTANSATSSSGLAVAGFVVLPLLGGFIGFAGYIAAALMLEPRPGPFEPTLSYGQQAVLISLPFCTVIGCAIGFGVAFLLVRRYLVSIVLLFVVSLISWGMVNSMWRDQIKHYGRDPSEVVLYYPPLAFSVLALAIALLVGVIATVRWQASVK